MSVYGRPSFGVAFRMRSIIPLSLLLVFSGAALAVEPMTKAPPILKNVGGNVWEAVHGAGGSLSTTRTWAKGTEVGSAKATDVFSWMYKQKTKIPLSATTKIGAGAVARAAAKAFPLVGAASVAYDIWQALGCTFEDGQVVCDKGVDPIEGGPATVKKWSDDKGGEYSDPSAACAAKFPNPGPGYVISSGELIAPTMMECRSNYGHLWGYITAVYVQETSGSSCPGQAEVRPDGKCPGGVKEPTGEPDLEDKYGKHGPKVPGFADKAPEVVGQAVDNGIPVTPGPITVTGPSSAPLPGSTTTTTPSGGGQSSTSTTNQVVNITYNGAQVIFNESTTTNNADGSTTQTSQESTLEWMCGIVGVQDCRVIINEEGMPAWEQPDGSKFDEIKIADAAKMQEVALSIPTPDLGWFETPPLASCEAIVFPNNMGEANPCGVVDSVRSIMAYIWALVAAWMAFGFIRQAVNGG